MTLEIYDTTLRDGAQGVGINFSVSDKVRIAEHLDRIGVTVIEGGWPGANQTDTEFFAEMRGATFGHARLAAFGATRRPGVLPQDDLQVRALVDSGAPVVTLVGKSWDAQVHDVLRTSLEENLRMIGETVAWLVDAGREVCYDAEHFFDGLPFRPRLRAGVPRGGAHRRRAPAGAVRHQRRHAPGHDRGCHPRRDRSASARSPGSTATTTPAALWPTRSPRYVPAPCRCRAASTATASAPATPTSARSSPRCS